MAVTKEESDKLLEEAQKCLNEVRDPNTDLSKRTILCARISQLVRYAGNIDLKIDPNTGSMSGKVLSNPEKPA